MSQRRAWRRAVYAFQGRRPALASALDRYASIPGQLARQIISAGPDPFAAYRIVGLALSGGRKAALFNDFDGLL